MFGIVLPQIDRQTLTALTVCLIAVVLMVTFIRPTFVANGDFYFHKDKVLGNFDEGNTRFESYAWLSHNIAAFFVYNIHSFYYVILIMNGIIVPMLLFFTCRRWIVVPLYFMVSNYFYFMFGYLAQSLAGIFILSLFVVKDNRIRLLLVVCSIPSHSQAFLIMSIAFILLLVFERGKAGMFLPGCTGIVGTNRPDELIDTKLAQPDSRGIAVSNLFTFFLRILAFPFFAMGIIQNWREKNYAPLALSAFAIIAAFFISPRILYIIPLLMLPAIAKFYYTLGWKGRLLYVGLAVVWGVWEFYFWFSDRVNCGDG